jgi:predicted dithiol-disulfide oxidoreductase (DUF899 family)
MAPEFKERGIDVLAPVWHLMDLTPQGRGEWYASLDYGPNVRVRSLYRSKLEYDPSTALSGASHEVPTEGNEI